LDVRRPSRADGKKGGTRQGCQRDNLLHGWSSCSPIRANSTSLRGAASGLSPGRDTFVRCRAAALAPGKRPRRLVEPRILVHHEPGLGGAIGCEREERNQRPGNAIAGGREQLAVEKRIKQEPVANGE